METEITTYLILQCSHIYKKMVHYEKKNQLFFTVFGRLYWCHIPTFHLILSISTRTYPETISTRFAEVKCNQIDRTKRATKIAQNEMHSIENGKKDRLIYWEILSWFRLLSCEIIESVLKISKNKRTKMKRSKRNGIYHRKIANQ